LVNRVAPSSIPVVELIASLNRRPLRALGSNASLSVSGTAFVVGQLSYERFEPFRFGEEEGPCTLGDKSLHDSVVSFRFDWSRHARHRTKGSDPHLLAPALTEWRTPKKALQPQYPEANSNVQDRQHNVSSNGAAC
jgi:hypothetical protein